MQAVKKFREACKSYTVRQMTELIWFYIWGHILGPLFYKRKYYYGRCFQGNFGGIAAPGWRWICIDVMGRRFNPFVPWPCSPQIRVGNYKNIHFHPDDINNFQGTGNYFQALDGHIYIGRGTWIAMNVGIITTNHSTENPDEHESGHDVVHRIIINWLYLHLILCQPIQLPPDLFHRACMSNGKLPALC